MKFCRPRSLASTVFVAGAVVFGAAPNAAAQAAADVSDTDLVVTLRSVTNSPMVTDERAQLIVTYLERLVNDLTGGGASEMAKAMEQPETFSSMDYLVKIKGNRMRVDMGGSSLLGRLAPDGSVTEWGVLDPQTNRVLNTMTFDRAVRDIDGAFRAFPGDYLAEEPTVSAEPETKTIGGYTVRRHSYSRELYFYPMGKGEGAPELVLRKSGSAWLAPAQDIQEADVALFLRMWAGTFADQASSGPLTSTGMLGDYGLMLASDDTTVVRLFSHLPGQEGNTAAQHPVELMKSMTSTAIIRIERPSLDPALFGGFDQGKQECDCSCDTWDKMQAIGKLPKAEIEKHPEAMKLAMCMPKCVSAFMACGKN